MIAHLFFGPNETPLSNPEEVKSFLGKPDLHWKEKYSAYETAHSWFAAGGLPPAIRAILHDEPTYAKATLVRACFEKQTQLDDSGRGPSQTDVLAYLNVGSKAVILGVEGKVNEPFGQLVSEWNDYSPGKLRRLAGLIEKLAIKPSKSIGSLRYQLMHRTVATLLEATKVQAADAVVLVQSFSPDDVRAGFLDFQRFATILGIPIDAPGVLSRPLELSGIRLRLGWTVNLMRETPD